MCASADFAAPCPKKRHSLSLPCTTLHALIPCSAPNPHPRQELADRGIAHFDLKCDNVLLQPRDPPSSQGPRGTPGSMQDALPFEVVLADFGESIQFDSRAKAGAPSLAAASG